MANASKTGPGSATLPRRGRFFSGYAKHKGLALMFLLPVVYYLVFRYFPIYGVLIAFKDFRFLDGILKSPWVGLEHFRAAFSLPEFWQVFSNTLIISGLNLLFGFPAPILFALLLNEIRSTAFKKTVQTISYLPHFLSWVVLAGVFMSFLSPSTGPVNALIKALGGKPLFFLARNDWFRTIIVSTGIWKDVGWGSIVYLAALAGVNPELYEAAVLDGAGRFSQTVHITIPSIMPVVTIMFIFAVGGIVKDNFDQIFNMYNAAVYETGDVLSTYVYREGLVGMKYSFSTAVGLFQNVIAFVLILLTNTFSKRFNEYGLW